MSQNLQNFAKFQKFQLDTLVDFEKCCKTHIYLQNFVPIQPKTSNILPKFCQKLATTLRVRGADDEWMAYHVRAARQMAEFHLDTGLRSARLRAAAPKASRSVD